MRVTIFGATGLLGKALMQEWRGDEVSGLGSKDVDIRSQEAISRIVAQQRPDWIVLAAAYTDVDGCESNRELAFAVNTQGATQVAEAADRLRPAFLQAHLRDAPGRDDDAFGLAPKFETTG